MDFVCIAVNALENLKEPYKTQFGHNYFFEIPMGDAIKIVELMNGVGIIDNMTPRPKSPGWRLAGINPNRAPELWRNIVYGHSIKPPPTDYEHSIASRAIEKYFAIYSNESPFPNMVPRYKFEKFFADWVITAHECQIISEKLKPMIGTEELGELIMQIAKGESPLGYGDRYTYYTDILKQWIAFNELAIPHGGYTIESVYPIIE